MANNYKSPKQVVPSVNTWTTLYTVPVSTQAVTSNMHVCNFGSSQATFRIALRPDGENLADKHYIFYGLNIAANDTVQLGDGITMEETDILQVYASSGSLSFNLSYAEVTS
jgi:hypothetical protein